MPRVQWGGGKIHRGWLLKSAYNPDVTEKRIVLNTWGNITIFPLGVQ